MKLRSVVTSGVECLLHVCAHTLQCQLNKGMLICQQLHSVRGPESCTLVADHVVAWPLQLCFCCSLPAMFSGISHTRWWNLGCIHSAYFETGSARRSASLQPGHTHVIIFLGILNAMSVLSVRASCQFLQSRPGSLQDSAQCPGFRCTGKMGSGCKPCLMCRSSPP